MPVSRYYPGNEKTSEYREGLYVGYRYFTTVNKAVRFPFGYGLSYTSFRYDGLTVDEKGASFDVTNTGDCYGDEIVQMYVSLPDAKIFRPARELRGFCRVGLNAGETKHVTIPFDDYSFRYFNVATDKWETESGEYVILIGASSEDIRLKGSFALKGTDAADPYADAFIYCYKNGHIEAVPDESFKALLRRDIPEAKWDRNKPLEMNDTIRQLFYAKNPVARFGYKILTKKVDKAIANGKPDLNMLFIYNMPFRGMGKMMNGMVTMDMAKDLLFMCNGHWHKGLFKLIHHFFHKPKIDLA